MSAAPPLPHAPSYVVQVSAAASNCTQVAHPSLTACCWAWRSVPSSVEAAPSCAEARAHADQPTTAKAIRAPIIAITTTSSTMVTPSSGRAGTTGLLGRGGMSTRWVSAPAPGTLRAGQVV